MGFFRSRWPLILILATVLVGLSPALRPGTAIGPWDDLRAMMDGEPTPRAFDVLQMDAVLQFYGWRDLVFESWGRGEPPFWNPYQLMGTPLLANSQSGGFYPFHILVGLLHVPTALGILLLAIAHLCIGGMGVRAFVHRLGGSEIGAAVGGALFAASPFMLSWVGLASVVTTCCWIPWALAFTHDVFGEGRARFRSAVWLGLSVAMMLLGGHLQFSAYGLMAVALFAVWQAVAVPRWTGLGLAVAGCVVGGLLAAPQVLPVLEFSKLGHRQNKPTEDGYAFYDRSAVAPIEAAGLVVPDLLGAPGRPAAIESDVPVTSFWPAYTKIGGNYAESALYLGPAVVLLLALALFRKGWREVGAVAAVGALGLLMALGTPVNRLLYFLVPGWSSTGSPGRAVVLFVIAACVLAGWAWPREGERTEMKGPLAVLLLVGALGFALVALFAPGLATWNPNLQEVMHGAVQGNLAFAGVVGLLSLVLTAVAGIGIARGGRAMPAVALVVAILLIAGPRLVPSGKPLAREPGDPNSRTAFVNADWQLLVGLPVVQPPNTATIQHKYDVAGYDSLMSSETFAILNEINGRDSAPEANGNMTLVKPGFNPLLLAQAGVTSVVSRSPSGETATVVLAGPGRASVDGRPATIASEGSMHLIVHATGPGTLTIRDRNLPGWTARRGATVVSLGTGRWREIELPEGEHQVKLMYVPPGLTTGLGLFALGGLLSLLGLVLHRPPKA
jgi:hypothetical protein